jgi:hypothetical protein
MKTKPPLKMDSANFARNFQSTCINKAKTSIRIQTGYSYRGANSTTSWDYFELDENGIITSCPRGMTKTYKGIQIINLDKLSPMRSPFDGSEI